MKKNQLIAIGAIIFVGGLLIGLISPFGRTQQVKPSAQIEKYQKQLTQKNKELAALQDKYDVFVDKQKDGESIGVDDTNAKKFFETILNVDKTTWSSRFDTAKKYGSQEAINTFSPDGFKGNKPSDAFKQSINTTTFYSSLEDKTKGVVVVDYDVETGMADPMNVVAYYQVTLDPDGKVATVDQVKMKESNQE